MPTALVTLGMWVRLVDLRQHMATAALGIIQAGMEKRDSMRCGEVRETAHIAGVEVLVALV
jgi:hypothetical protein